MKNLICRILGHKPKAGELKRSPYTVYTHGQDIHCERCGVYLAYHRHYKDALTEPQFFRTSSAEPSGPKPHFGDMKGQQPGLSVLISP